MFRFFNNDETGVEGVTGAVTNAAKKTVKSASDQTDAAAQDIVNQLYGLPSTVQDENEDTSTEGFGQQGKSNAAQKAQTNIRNPTRQQAARRQAQLMQKGYKSEDIDKLEKLRKQLHDEQVRDIFEPKKKQEEEEPVKEKLDREEEEKKRKKQEEEVKDQKKKEQLAVVNERTRAERRPGAG